LPEQANYGNHVTLTWLHRSLITFKPQLGGNFYAQIFIHSRRKYYPPPASQAGSTQLAMKQYVIDELRLDEHSKIRKYLDETYGPADMGEIYWVPLTAEVLTEIQLEHSDCQPFYFAIEVAEDRLAVEMLVRTKNRIRCACIGYASKEQRFWIMDVVDGIFEKLDIAT
jgi:hypothetical protein